MRHHAVHAQKLAVFRALDDAPAGGDHLPAHERNAPERLRLAAAEPRLALGFKDARDGHARRLFDFPVQIHKRHAQPRRRQRAHGALARARHAHQRKARHRAPERPLGLPSALRGHGPPGEALARPHRLIGQHRQPAFAGDAQRPRLLQKPRAQRVIDHVRHAAKVRKPRKVHRRGLRPGVHAHGRGVDEPGRVRVALKVFVVGFARARDGHRLAARRLHHVARRFGRAAAAQNERLGSGEGHARAPGDHAKAVGVGVVAKEGAVRPAHDGVDAADGLRRGAELAQIRDHRLLVGNRHVQPVKFALFKERPQLLRRQLDQVVAVVREQPVQRFGMAVPQLFADQSAAHLSPPNSCPGR